MLINVHDLRKRQNVLDFEQEFPPEGFDLGVDVRAVQAVKTSGRATLVEEHTGHKGTLDDIRVAGKLATELEVLCARCLEPVKLPVHREFELLYRPQGSDVGGGKEVELQDKDAAISYYEGDGLALEDVVREQLLLAVPIKTVCKEECKGLCAHCGRNLNTGQCECAQSASDPRWEALKGLKDKLQK
ncbi:MAG TPA: DUF177 domain-containing protein [Terriglobales bacterium]|nr:DUF177 domain-containing protein [Terriglobales bacterium]